MCGIAGVASTSARHGSTWLSSAVATLRHRGPDDAGEWWTSDMRVGLGHARLSVIDTSLVGHQPMQDATERTTIVFNGEIYNFPALREELTRMGATFKTQTDTEVLLNAYTFWGLDCLHHLNGMFAFALFDSRLQRLFLARDRVGEKPLFYHFDGQTIHFASELKAMLSNGRMPKTIDYEALCHYLTYGYAPSSQCLVKDFHKLPPAHAMVFDLSTAKHIVWRYWNIPGPPVEDVGPSRVEAFIEELDCLLSDAVQRQLISDVPLGVLLSGGLDSSLIVAMATKFMQRVRTFTVRFPGHGERDETHHARLIADYFGTEHTELVAEPVVSEELVDLAWFFDEPIIDSSVLPTSAVCRLVQKDCTVALGGDGGDELFGGYEHYSRALQMKQRVGFVPLSLRRYLAHGASRLMPVGFRGRGFAESLAADFEYGIPIRTNFFNADTARALLSARVAPGDCVHQPSEGIQIRQHDLVERSTRWDFMSYLPENILVKIDRASMRTSLEVRSPFLDHTVVSFAFGRVPSSLKSTATNRKILLKLLGRRRLPVGFDYQRKQGFSAPLAEWLSGGELADFFKEVLLDSGSLFSPRTVQGLLRGQERGRSNSERLFGLVFFELWRRGHGIEPS